jgi:membrane protein required for colicin V production
MQPYDIGMLLVLIGATVFGFLKGAAWQLASLGSLVASYFVSLRFSEVLAPYISAKAPWNRFLAMLVLYLVTSLLIWIAFRYVSGFIDRVKLREFDRQLGFLLGAAKGVLYCVVITFFAVTLSEDAREKVLRSRSGYYIAVLIHRAQPVMPPEVHQLLGPYLDQLNRQLDPRQPPAPEPRGRGRPEAEASRV